MDRAQEPATEELQSFSEETDLGPLPAAEGPGLFLLKSPSILKLMCIDAAGILASPAFETE